MAERRFTLNDFETLKEVGQGAFGKICLVRKKVGGGVYAMKVQSKSFLIEQDQIDNIKAEREILANADNEWIIKMFFSFQDEKYLFEVLEYCPGGDFFGLLVREDKLSEDDAKFYISELCKAISTIHNLGFSHRDVKPDNLLIARDGHLKLSDFGLSKKVKRVRDYDALMRRTSETPASSSANLKPQRRKRALMSSLVGTPDYVAVEILSNSGYDKTVDWWSVGVIFYECLMGYPPFYADDVNTVCRKIMDYKNTLVIPSKYNVSEAAQSLIFSLIIAPESRLVFEQITVHPFFKDVPWDELKSMKPPFMPQLDSIVDTRYFDHEDDEDKNADDMFTLNEYQPRVVMDQQKFQDFTFVRRDKGNKRSGLDGLFDEIAPSDEEQETDDDEEALAEIDEEAALASTTSIPSINENGFEIVGAMGVNKNLINGKYVPEKQLKYQGLPVWKRIDLPLVFWYWSKRSCWMLTREVDLGSDRIYCVVRCDVQNPAEITGNFFVWDPTAKKLMVEKTLKIKPFNIEIFE